MRKPEQFPPYCGTLPSAMEYTTHTTLLTRLSEGVDPAAWNEFHDRYADLFRGFARRYGLQPADCDDIAQEVLLALSRSMGGFKYDPSKGKFRSYLKTLSLRTIFRNLRQKRDHKVLEDIETGPDKAGADPSVEAKWENEWRQHHIRQAMRRLEPEFNERDRMAFSQYAMTGRPASEAAKALGMSVDQVYQAKSRILRRLTELIGEQVRDEG
jgi:RNA polymerase sigma-70 factor (ECF subfamily)